MPIKPYLLCAAMTWQLAASAQITCQQSSPTLGRRGAHLGLWPGGLFSFFCTGLTLSTPLSRSTKAPLPYKVEGITVAVGTDFSGDGGLPAPIIEVADSGDYQQVTVQVPWEYQRYIVSSTGITVSV